VFGSRFDLDFMGSIINQRYYLSMEKQLWLFASYAWQGNPKALFLYMQRYHLDKECIWAADDAEQALELQLLGVRVINVRDKDAKDHLKACAVYVTENNREYYPPGLNKEVTVLNLWHGVGLKPVEIGVGADSDFSKRVAKKYINYFDFYRRNHLFLAPSEKMAERFTPDLKLLESQIIKGPYPRNLVYQDQDLRTYDFEQVTGHNPSHFGCISLYAPTWRRRAVNTSFRMLLPDLASLTETLAITETLLIINVHPFTRKDPAYLQACVEYQMHPNILFWPDEYDVYEYFSLIDRAIIDYSSIFYDLLAAGVSDFIRYVPDYEEHLEHEGFTDDYWSLTSGAVVEDFSELSRALASPPQEVQDTDRLYEYFFGYSDRTIYQQDVKGQLRADIEKVIDAAVSHIPSLDTLPVLYSFDIFDTLVRRKSISPIAPFYRLQEILQDNKLKLPSYLLENFVEIRRACERAARAFKRDTRVELESDLLEVTFDEIYARLKQLYSLSNKQISYLKAKELEIDATLIEPHFQHLDRLKQLVAAGEKVILISDMYLSSSQIMQLIGNIDPVLSKIPIFVSSEIGHKKDSGKLFTSIFFELDYEYSNWVHYGDNKIADGREPRKLGISAYTHTMDEFLPYEQNLIVQNRNLDTYKVATLMQRYRHHLLDKVNMDFNESKYFAYAYLGPAFVCYVSWVIKNSLSRGYQTLYFITRDGIYLKEIADILIAKRGLRLKTKLIYGSRKAWRIARTEEELLANFNPIFGSIGGIRTFKEFVGVSLLSRDVLLDIVPELAAFKEENFSKPNVRNAAIELLLNNKAYRVFLKSTQLEKYENCMEYLRREIDLEKPFAFVEFWGRGVTQGRLTEYLSEIAGKPVTNPFYYVSSIWGDEEGSPRHRFSELDFHFSFLEPVLASVLQTSVTGYEKRGSRVEPLYDTISNSFYTDFLEGLADFAEDYAKTSFDDEVRLDRTLSNTVYQYLRGNPTDQFVCNVFAKQKDNHGMYTELREYAPSLTVSQINKQNGRQLGKYTKSIPISLARSDDSARNAYKKLFPTTPMPPKSKQVFPTQALSKYISVSTGESLFAVRDLKVYECATFTSSSHMGVKISAGEFFLVHDCIWTNSGIPRILTEYGFVTADKKFFSKASAIVLRKPVRGESKTGDIIRYENNVVFAVTRMKASDGKIWNFETERGELRAQKEDVVVVREDIENYHSTVHLGVVALKKVSFFKTISLVKNNAIADVFLQKGQWIKVLGVEWTKFGTPVLKTAKGFISAHISVTREARRDIEKYLIWEYPALQLLEHARVYSSTNFESETKTAEKIPKGTIIKEAKIAWSDDNTPRLKIMEDINSKEACVTEKYISANLKMLRVVRADIDNYLHNDPIRVLLYQNLRVYKSVEFVSSNYLAKLLVAGTVVETLGIEWSADGTPRIKVQGGYLSANREFVRSVRGDLESYHFKSCEKLVLAKEQSVYSDINLTEQKTTLQKGTEIKAVKIVWTPDGTPRIAIKAGFLSAKLKNFR